MPKISIKPITRALLVAVMFAMTGWGAVAPPASAQSGADKVGYVPVMRVYKAEVRRTGDTKAPFVLVVWGQVNSGGWGAVRLRPYSVRGEPNSTWRFRLEAIPPKPGTLVTAALVNVSARLPLTGIGPHVHTFTIDAQSNSIQITPIPKPAKKGG